MIIRRLQLKFVLENNSWGSDDLKDRIESGIHFKAPAKLIKNLSFAISDEWRRAPAVVEVLGDALGSWVFKDKDM